MPSPTHPVLQQIHRLDISSSGFSDRLGYILFGPEYNQCVPNLGGHDLRWLIEYLDEVLGCLDRFNRASRKCLHELGSICSSRGILPMSYMLSPDLLNTDDQPFVLGDRREVYRGTFGRSRVCVKHMRVYQNNCERTSQIFYQEAVTWKRVTHAKVLSLRGVIITPDRFMFVSNFMSNGTLLDYIKNQDDPDKLRLLSDVAEGLCYLHSCNVIHGGIKATNILVDDSGHALITGFSRAVVKGQRSKPEAGFDVQWTAPEVLSEGLPTKQGDIFSFAMLVVEVFTCAAPFVGRSYAQVILDVMEGGRPPRPKDPLIAGHLWRLIQRCWNQDPHLRPVATEVLGELLASNPPAWKKLITCSSTVGEYITLVESIFSDHDEVGVFDYLHKDDAQALINIIYEVLDNLPQHTRKGCICISYRICGNQGLLPQSLQIPLCYNLAGMAECSGGFADVWRGQYHGQKVAAKVLRVCASIDIEQIRRRFCREVILWRTLCHPNVLPLLGVTMTAERLVMVLEWMDNGNIVKFLRNHPNVNRLTLLRGATEGLIYMHGRKIIHGDLKGANIMINNNCHACLTDFSLTRSLPNSSLWVTSCVEGGTYQWMSPELLEPKSFNLERSCPTLESDYYALGMVVYEVLSGKVPFEDFGPFGAVPKILMGERPQRPHEERGALFTDEIWAMVEHCWRHNPSDRANAMDVFQCLGGTIPQQQLSSFDMEVDGEVDLSDQLDMRFDHP